MTEPGTRPTLNDEALELIDRLLSGYEIALENILYKNGDITEDITNINRARLAIDYALHGYKDADDELSTDPNEDKYTCQPYGVPKCPKCLYPDDDCRCG